MAVVAVKLPDVGEGVTEVELVEWLVKPGDIVREDDPLAAVMTDKATVEIPSLHAGTVTWVAGGIGDMLSVGSDLVRIETGAVAAASVAEAEAAPGPAAEKATAP